MTPREELIKICDELGHDINNLTEDNWYGISKYQYLFEEFIESYKKYLDTDHVSLFQKLSEEFIEKHKEWLYMDFINRSVKPTGL